MPDRSLRLGIDASGARVGAEEYRRATESIRAQNRHAVEGIRAVEQALAREGEAAARTGQQMSGAFQRVSGTFAGGGSIRTGVSQIGNELDDASTSAVGFGTALGSLATRIGPLGLLAAANVGVAKAIKNGTANALALEKALAAVAARTPAGDIHSYEFGAVELSRELNVDRLQAANAYRTALLSGFKTFQEQQEAATIGLKLFKIEGVDASQAIALLDANLDAYDRTADRSEETTNKLLAAAQSGETTFEDMARAVAQVGAVASPMGISLEEVASVLASVAPRVGGASSAASGLSNLILQLSDSTSSLNDELRKNGIEIDATTIRTQGLASTLAQVGQGLEGQETILAQVFGNPRIARVALSAVEDGGARTKEVLASIRQEVDLLNTSLEKVQGQSGEKLDTTWGKIKSLVTEAGQGIVGLANDATTGFGETSKMVDGLRHALTETAVTGRTLSETLPAHLAPSFEEVQRLREANEELERAKVVKEFLARGGFFPRGEEFGPPAPIPEAVRRNLPPSQHPLGPDASAEFLKAQQEADDLARTLNQQLGSALDQEIARIRSGEIVIRQKIDAYAALGAETGELEAQLFALVQADDAAIRKMLESDKAAKLAADSHARAGIAALEYAQNVSKLRGEVEQSLPVMQALAAAGIAAARATAHGIGRGEKAFQEGPQRLVEDFQFQASLIGKTAEEQDRLTTLRQFDIEALRLQAEGFDFLGDRVEAAREKLKAAIDEKEFRAQMEQLGHAFADPIAQGLDSWITGLSSFHDAFEQTIRGIFADLARLYVIKPLQQSIVGLFTGNAESRMGNVIERGHVIPYAQGGIPDVGDQPALFPMAGGRTGSLREGGKPEAIMPLRRTASGELGVNVAGGRDRRSEPPTVINHRPMKIDIHLASPGDSRSRRQMLDELRTLASAT